MVQLGIFFLEGFYSEIIFKFMQFMLCTIRKQNISGGIMAPKPTPCLLSMPIITYCEMHIEFIIISYFKTISCHSRASLWDDLNQNDKDNIMQFDIYSGLRLL